MLAMNIGEVAICGKELLAEDEKKSKAENGKMKRSGGLDLIRCVAVFFVISSHFYIHGGFYETPLIGGRLFVATTGRWIFFSCVPLFIMLSGFLQSHKSPDKAYYLKSLRILFEYLVAGSICNLYSIFALGQAMTFRNWIGSFIKFSAAPYAWYVNLYFGLFLLIPFLNLIYNGLSTRKSKKLLIGTLLLLTALPAAINGTIQIFPDWWVRIYPISYYFIGCYFAEYKPKQNRMACLLGVAVIAVLEAAFSFSYAKGGGFSRIVPYDYGALANVVLSVLVFLALYDVHLGDGLGKIMARISEAAFSIYLVSWVFDNMLYTPLKKAFPLFLDCMPWYIILVPTVFICSAICGEIISFARKKLV